MSSSLWPRKIIKPQWRFWMEQSRSLTRRHSFVGAACRQFEKRHSVSKGLSFSCAATSPWRRSINQATLMAVFLCVCVCLCVCGDFRSITHTSGWTSSKIRKSKSKQGGSRKLLHNVQFSYFASPARMTIAAAWIFAASCQSVWAAFIFVGSFDSYLAMQNGPLAKLICVVLILCNTPEGTCFCSNSKNNNKKKTHLGIMGL